MDAAHSMNNPFFIAGVAMMILGLALTIRAMFQASALRATAADHLATAYRQGLERGREEGAASSAVLLKEGATVLARPSEEGWWWYLKDGEDSTGAIPVEVYLHGGTLKAWHGNRAIFVSSFARWQKIETPIWENRKEAAHGQG